MSEKSTPEKERAADKAAPHPAATLPEEAGVPEEVGGRKGPEPTRYGDWEVGGICSDF